MNILIIVLAVVLDRITKIIAAANLSSASSISVIKGLINFTYTQNTGAAFSIFSGHTMFLGVFSAVVSLGIIYFLIMQKKKNKGKKLYIASIAMIIGGAVGNMIDRFIYGYVVDFIEFAFVDFPIFNVADIFITIGAILFCVCLIFDRKIQL